jgi:carboxyl-terminal processing protease
MPRRVLFFGVFLAIAAFAGMSNSPLRAQEASTISIISHEDEISDQLRLGHQLEIESRWGEALSLYEEALRAFPEDDTLHRRFEFSRLHYDVVRRYVDRSFLSSLENVPSEKALELYSQVLLKIQSHYVETVNWKQLIERGTNNLEIALAEPTFVNRNLSRGGAAGVAKFRGELRRTIGARIIRSRADARDAVAAAAKLAGRRLGIDATPVILEYLCGATNTLDPYSTYLTPDQLGEVYAQIDGNFVGLGIELKARRGQLEIVRVITGSPAEQSGVKQGDRIVSVDGRSTLDISTDKAANLLQGDAGTSVKLVLAAPDGQTRPVSVTRRRVDVPSVDGIKIIDQKNGIGYFQLACFQKTTCQHIDAALWKLHREGMRSLIIDLRGNPGGLLVTAVDVVDKFVSSGIIVSTRGRNSQEDFTYTAHAEGTWSVPLVVLIDGDSASAAEIFAGAIRDHHRGTIIGARSYGKGSVQGIFPLTPSTAGVRLTTAKFYSPAGHPFSHVGVEPDVKVRKVNKPVDGSPISTAGLDDAVLEAALQTAQKLVQR